MALAMRVLSLAAKSRAWANFSLLMDLYMKVSLETTKLMERESIHGQMAKNMWVSGRITRWMAKAISNGVIIVNTKDNSKMIKDMDKAYLYGKMVNNIMEHGSEENNMELEISELLTQTLLRKVNGKMERK